ncbi:MAG: DUF4381 domain-containing protein [Burkholderiales bacterium]|nr:DUF4381 domain-containing protein [Burkholderiales bacterium]
MGGLNPGAAAPAWLAELRPDRAPPAPGWWPPAPGWWALAALLVVALGVAAFVIWRHRRTRLERAALRELARLEASAGGADEAALAAGIEHVLRRYALARYGRPAVAALTGRAWLDFAVRRGAADWAGDPGRHLLAAAYGGAVPAERARWLSGARGFIGWREPRAEKKKP